MRVDVEFLEKGSIVLCDLLALDPRPRHFEDLLDRSGYESIARKGQLFFFEPLDAIAGKVSIFVDETLPPALVERVYGTVDGRLLRVPNGEIVVCPVQSLAEDAPSEEPAKALRVNLAPGDYLVDAHVLAPTDAEIAGPQPKGRARCFQGFLILAVGWFVFCTICYVGLVYSGLAREALPIFAVVGAAPLALSIILFYATGSRRRVAEASKAYAAQPSTPSLAVVLSQRGDDAAVTEGGGIVEDAYAEQLKAFSANW